MHKSMRAALLVHQLIEEPTSAPLRKVHCEVVPRVHRASVSGDDAAGCFAAAALPSQTAINDTPLLMSSPPSSRPALRSALSGGSSPQHSHRDTPTDGHSFAPSQTSTAVDHPASTAAGGGAHIHFPQGLAPDGKEAAAGAGSGGGKSGFKRTRTMSSDLGKGFRPKGASLLWLAR
jgi:hypothetical protein